MEGASAQRGPTRYVAVDTGEWRLTFRIENNELVDVNFVFIRSHWWRPNRAQWIVIGIAYVIVRVDFSDLTAWLWIGVTLVPPTVALLLWALNDRRR
jgi:hypothetical protein